MNVGILIHPEELTRRWIDRMAEGGVNTLGLHPKGGKGAAASLKELLVRLQTEEYRSLLDYAKGRGLQIEYRFHAAGYLLDRELFFSHPEYFRLNAAGERSPDWNFCPSNPEALALVCERAVELAERLYQSEPRYYFWLDDARDAWCHCERCRGLSDSDQQLLVLNAVLAALRRKRPEAKLSYLAYFSSMEPPRRIKPAEGIFLEYAPIDRWRKEEGGEFLLGAQREERMRPALLEFFGKADATVLEYWLDNSLFSRWKHPPKPFVCDGARVKADVKRYCQEGFDHISTFGCFLGEEYEALYGEADLGPFFEALHPRDE